jgi:hypothetical protein
MTFTIPDSPEGLQELLADDAKRTEVFADPESTKDFLNKYSAAVDKSGDIAAQVTESVQATITDMLKEREIEDRPDQAQINAEIAASMSRSLGRVRSVTPRITRTRRVPSLTVWLIRWVKWPG